MTVYNGSFLASIERNQIRLSRSLLVMLYLVHIFAPQFNSFTKKFIELSYPIGNGLYVMGIDDIYYIVNWVVNLTFLRSFLMLLCLKLANTRFIDVRSRKLKVRFAEQSWTLCYATLSFAFGVYLYVISPYYNDLDQVYISWPHTQMTPLLKKYYLISIGFWIQTLFAINIEEKRKDYLQMFCHHIITVLLMTLSYYQHYVRIGHMILMLMDLVDIVLSAAKIFKYAGYLKFCDVLFVVFLITWIISRHIIYNVLLYHCWAYAGKLMDDDLQCTPGVVQEACWSYDSLNIFMGLLGGLQVILIIWMFSIVKVAYRVITGTGAEDVRSDDEEAELLEEEEEARLKLAQESKKRVHRSPKKVIDVEIIDSKNDDIMEEDESVKETELE